MDAVHAAAAGGSISGVVAFAIYTFHTLRADVRAEICELRQEMRSGFAEIRAQLARIERARS